MHLRWLNGDQYMEGSNWYSCQSAHCAVRDPAVLQEAQAETTDRGVRIAKDVSVLRIDRISIKGMLLGGWQISDSGQCDPLLG
jgi:hypothetical protein